MNTAASNTVFHLTQHKDTKQYAESCKPGDDVMILAEGCCYNMDCYKTKVNNNVLIVGTSGSGKTRSIVTPNILQASGSYVISDPKGVLYKKYAVYLRKKGYQVRKLNFADPGDAENASYNFFRYIRNDQDILKIANMLVNAAYTSERIHNLDPFWDDSTELLLVAIIHYLHHHTTNECQNLKHILRLAQACEVVVDNEEEKNPLDFLFEDVEEYNADDFGVACYKQFRQSAGRTLKSILITLFSKLSVFNTPQLRHMLAEDTVRIDEIGKRKTAVFVIVSDTDRSMDKLANIFFSQAMNELCSTADEMPGQRLPVDVRFILDDFATNVQIAEFPRMISSIRSRGISAMLMIQSESQLTSAYGEDGRTIISNCDTYVYLGGNDVETARSVARRADTNLRQILYMPIGECWVFRRGQFPVKTNIIDLDEWIEKHKEKRENKAPSKAPSKMSFDELLDECFR